MNNEGYLRIKDVAMICHNGNRVLCEAQGDHTQMSWEDTSHDIRLSAIKGVEYALLNPDATPEMQHEAWSESKTKDGWVYGVNKNMVEKTHPCLVPYEQLEAAQKSKDYLFNATVKSLSSFILPIEMEALLARDKEANES